MDNDRFDNFSRMIDESVSRRVGLRHALGLTIGGLAALVGWSEADARKRRKRRRKKRSKKRPTGCPAGRRCPDGKCGKTCCKNGRACDVVCSGPTGSDYCCDATRPAAICGGCWTAGSTQCAAPKHCCSPNQKCCGNTHCCAEGWECKLNCGGVQGSNACCKIGSATCCPDGIPG